MRVLIGLRGLRDLPPRAVVTIGMFDGLHVGHQRLIQTTIRLATQLGGSSVLLTFHPDPRQVLHPRDLTPPLMPLEERLRLIKAMGIELAWIIRFTNAFSRMSAEQFVQRILVRRLRPACIVVGEGFAFGRQRRGSLSLLRKIGQRHGIRIITLPTVSRGGVTVSSSRIRQLIHAGDLTRAQRWLGRRITLSGTVVRGAGRARRLGFPTANVRLAKQFLPPPGVYRVVLEAGQRRWQGVMNLGSRPTFLPHHWRGGAGPLVCEVHLLGFRGNLYGRSVTIRLAQRLRDERRFPHPDDLAQQITQDIAQARAALSSSS